MLQLFCAVALLSELDDFDNLALLLQFYSYSALQLCCLSLTTLTTLLAGTTLLRMSLTNSLKWLTLTTLLASMPSLLSCLTSELDDFDNPAGWDDFTLQVFDKFPEVDDFHNLADFDAFTVRVDLADFDA